MSYSGAWERRAQEAAKPHIAKVARARRSLARLDPAALEAVAEAAIGLLDEASDPDADHCLAGDDGCGAFFGGEHRGWHWGSQWESEADIGHAPEYATDQREIMGRWGVAFRVD
ncbi:MAG: hypothetical protein K2Y17_08335 [Qipengyuania sp.]|nr:hypothetical protein [Qipengyuania sp.]